MFKFILKIFVFLYKHVGDQKYTKMSSNQQLTDALEANDYEKATTAIMDKADNLNSELLKYSAKENKGLTVAFLLNHGATNLSAAMLEAAKNKNLSYAIIFHEHGLTDFDEAIKEFLYVTNSSVQNVQLIFPDSTLTEKREYMMAMAARIGDNDSINYYSKLGCSNYNLAYANAAETNQLDTCKLLVSLGANDHNWALQCASMSGASTVIDYAHAMGATNNDVALTLACKNGRLDRVKAFLEKGATKLLLALETAVEKGSVTLIKYCVARLKTEHGREELLSILEKAKKQGFPFVIKLIEQAIENQALHSVV